MPGHNPVLFETPRLRVRVASEGDAEVFYALWTDPQVMVHVGFPKGLRVTRDEIRARLREPRDSELDALLVIEERDSLEPIGECMVHRPDEQGVARVDAKLLPRFWGHRYGIEVARGLFGYAFARTKCVAVQTTPGINNVPSVRIQESLCCVRLGRGVHFFPQSMRDHTEPVHHYIYYLRRDDWQACCCMKR